MSDFYCPECGVIPERSVTAVKLIGEPIVYFCPKGHRVTKVSVKCPVCGTKMKRAFGSLTCPKCRLRFTLNDIA